MVVLPDLPACCQVEITVPGYPDIITESNEPMSMPSSKALVDTTPINFLFRNLCSISRLSLGK
ncbi:unnamed protein product [marine sediment metagenome]|uniref:Uncharacterized protein n=1 Tax=marine sediment metagenome TaxID=412755 RepID=X1UQH6_9ZZZZ